MSKVLTMVSSGNQISDNEIESELKAIRKSAGNLLKSKKASLEFLFKTGMYTKTGRLKKQFSVK